MVSSLEIRKNFHSSKRRVTTIPQVPSSTAHAKRILNAQGLCLMIWVNVCTHYGLQNPVTLVLLRFVQISELRRSVAAASSFSILLSESRITCNASSRLNLNVALYFGVLCAMLHPLSQDKESIPSAEAL
jgi:hypothetical protein